MQALNLVLGILLSYFTWKAFKGRDDDDPKGKAYKIVFWWSTVSTPLSVVTFIVFFKIKDRARRYVQNMNRADEDKDADFGYDENDIYEFEVTHFNF